MRLELIECDRCGSQMRNDAAVAAGWARVTRQFSQSDLCPPCTKLALEKVPKVVPAP